MVGPDKQDVDLPNRAVGGSGGGEEVGTDDTRLRRETGRLDRYR